MARPPLLTRFFVLAFLCNFLQGTVIHCYVHVPGFFARLGAEEVTIGLLYSAMALSGIAARPWVGRIMDGHGRRLVILGGSAIHVVACLLYLTIDRIGPLLVFVRILHGVANGTLFSALFTYAADVVPEARRTEGISIFGVSGLLPLSLGGLVGDLLLRGDGYSKLFQLTAALAFVALLMAIPLRDVPTAISATRRGYLAAIVEPALMPLWFVGIVFALGLAPVFVFLKVYLAEIDVPSVGLFLTAYTIAAVTLRITLGWLPDRVGPKRMLVPAIVTLAVGLVVLAQAHSSSLVGLAGTLCGIGHGFSFPILSSLVITRASAAERGVAMATFTAVFDVGFLVGGPTFGLLIRSLGYTWAYVIAAGSTLLGVTMFVAWDRRR